MKILLVLLFAALAAATVFGQNYYRHCDSYPTDPLAYITRITQELVQGQLPPCAIQETIDMAQQLSDPSLCVTITKCEGKEAK